MTDMPRCSLCNLPKTICRRDTCGFVRPINPYTIMAEVTAAAITPVRPAKPARTKTTARSRAQRTTTKARSKRARQ